MSFKDLDIEECYESNSSKTDLLERFYIPILSESIEYNRIAGFFSSSSLVVASKGIEGLIKNNGKMKLLISPRLSEQDFNVIKEYNYQRLSEHLGLFDSFNIDEFKGNDNLEALAWMLKNDKLEIKIVIDKNSRESIFHQKVGIFTDKEGNMISFSGSINETAQAWLNNIEEFKTFKSWEFGQLGYLTSDLKKFNDFWNNKRESIAQVYDLPESIKQQIIEISPRNIHDLFIMKKYKTDKEEREFAMSLFKHQELAVEKWCNNHHRLLMEMATGTGKTRTAIGCFMTLKGKVDKFLVIVSTPQNTLSRQWKNDIENELQIEFDISKIIDGSNSKWKKDLETIMLDINSGIYKDGIIFTTHDTSSNSIFIKIINESKHNLNILYICDEVHAIGSDVRKKALIDSYDYRIGLSATPERMYDNEGTQLIRSYFGNNSFEFTIRDALTTINPLTKKPFLNDFYYIPVFVELNDDELSKYNSYTKKIAFIMNQDEKNEEQISKLKISRANVLKNAENKYSAVENIVDRLNEGRNLKDTIIFCSDKQISKIMEMFSSKQITRCKITEEESASRIVGVSGNTEREECISQFRKGQVQVLLGIKCLDEGIDIKNARIAILMSSSTNPREYVQRIGRVIRIAPNKEKSIIYDLIVNTNDSILKKEASRALQIAQNAINFDEVKKVFLENGVDLDGDQ